MKLSEGYIVIDEVDADQLQAGDLVQIDDEFVEVIELLENDDPNQVVVVGYNYESGDKETYPPVAYDSIFQLWGYQ
jgi:hypothetical protein